MTRQQIYFQLADLFNQVAESFGDLGNAEIPDLPEDPPGPPEPPISVQELSKREREIVNWVYTQKGIQISKVNPRKYPGPIGIEVAEFPSPFNGYGETLEEAAESFGVPTGGDSEMPETWQAIWRKYLDDTVHASAVRRDGKKLIWVDAYRKSTGVTKDGPFAEPHKAAAFANQLPEK